ncbi:hypothetical protein CCS41_00915 [Candidatus Fukatsuia symbiotica]|uniref:Uncharacterized protein n=1 Tax=Candidatus Fukatsuia symbiotica TaxID=1878942 RepID=A0A2U8I2P9_9GAMM|nr:hypothetical protein CCS41_00915 [Candidatus Fukatsuia symbiotica]
MKVIKVILFIQEGVSVLDNKIILQNFDMQLAHPYNTQYRTIQNFFEIFSKYFIVLEYDFILQNMKKDSKYMYFVLKNL